MEESIHVLGLAVDGKQTRLTSNFKPFRTHLHFCRDKEEGVNLSCSDMLLHAFFSSAQLLCAFQEDKKPMGGLCINLFYVFLAYTAVLQQPAAKLPNLPKSLGTLEEER